MDPRYSSYSTYLKEKFGFRVQKVSVDVGFTCPNRDGSVAIGGCVYCNNDSFVPSYARSRVPLKDQIKTGMEYLKKRFKAQKFIIYFQAYTNTYEKIEKLEEFYREALDHEDVVGLAVGTRSDCVDEEKIRLFENLAKDRFVTLEYGIESIYDKTLEYINRGHNYKSILGAIRMTKDRGIHIGAHIIVGFPTETNDEMVRMAEEISRLEINFLKIHNLHIVKNTPLARMYAKEPFRLFNYEEYLEFISHFIERLSPKVIIERFFTDTPHDLLIEPKWNKTHLEIMSGIEKELEKRNTYQGRLFKHNTVKSENVLT
ncbi:MAG: TIGR01212 family radical SAM protein [Candidatus Dadabacteria bacterium]|nr:TIGR01212 family radical SAM protein [Candidatus Dadabacteria bacterium]